MLAATGRPAAGDNARLYLVPGMLHCGGGDATDQFEMLDAIVHWVEDGRRAGSHYCDEPAATESVAPALSFPWRCPLQGR